VEVDLLRAPAREAERSGAMQTRCSLADLKRLQMDLLVDQASAQHDRRQRLPAECAQLDRAPVDRKPAGDVRRKWPTRCAEFCAQRAGQTGNGGR